jgi:NAD kinase
MNAMVTCIEHIIQNSGKEGRAKVTGLYMEEWALDLISVHTDLMERAIDHSVTLIRWGAGATSSSSTSIAETKNEFGSNAMNGEYQKVEQKTFQDFSFVYCIGGDGTLLRLLRVLFYKCFPPTLPKIITFSMGSLNYLCNFDIKECK